MSSEKQDVREAIKSEYRKCASDVTHFLKKYCVIQHPQRGKIPFHLYEFQERTLGEFVKHRYNIIAKGRQLGMSTVVGGYALWKMIYTNDYKILIIATTQDVAKELLSKIQLMYDKLPAWIKSYAKQDLNNKLALSFSNGSSVRAVSSSERSARSPSLSLLIVDECAFIEKFEDIWTAAQATLSTGGDAILLSSVNGAQGLFYDLWTSATEGENSSVEDPFNPIYLPWSVHPERTQAWADGEKSKLGARKFAQEHSVEFLTSGHTVIEGEILQKYIDHKIKDPKEKRYGGDFWIWQYPKPTKSYVLSADVARGDGADYSAFHIYEVETMSHCASYKSKIDTRDYAKIILIAAMEWNNALLVVDNHSLGWDVIQSIVDARYPNLYYTYRNDPFFDQNIHLRKNLDLRDKKDMTPGFTSSTKLRLNLISKLESSFTDPDFKFDMKCMRTINELKTFMWSNGKAQASRNGNDDLVMALAQFLFVHDTALRLRSMGIELTKKAVSNIHRSVYSGNTETSNVWKRDTPHGQEDIRWLIDRKY